MIDRYTKTVLTVIAAGLVALVALIARQTLTTAPPRVVAHVTGDFTETMREMEMRLRGIEMQLEKSSCGGNPRNPCQVEVSNLWNDVGKFIPVR
jgi:hypothetical protein